MGACASRFKVSKDSGDAPSWPFTKEEAVVEEEVKERDEGLVAAADDESKHQSLGQMLIQGNEEDKVPSKASGALEQEDTKPRENETLKSLEAAEEADKTEEKQIQTSNPVTFEKVEDNKPVAEPVKAVEFEGNEESATGKKPEAKKIENESEQIC